MGDATKKTGEPDVVYSEQVQAAMDGDPKIAEFLRDFAACARQAMDGVQSGKYESFDDAMEAITGNRPELIDDLDAD